MTPQEKADTLVNQYKNILMTEDTDCGEEIICTVIAIKCAQVTANEMIEYILSEPNWQEKESYWQTVIKELNTL